MTPEDLVDVTFPLIRSLGSAFQAAPDTVARAKEIGLDVFQFFFLGRGGLLGDVEPAVLTSALGHYPPATVEQCWTMARQVVPPRDAALVFLASIEEFGRVHLTEVGGLDSFCAAAEAVTEAADSAGLPVYAGSRIQPLPEDVPGRAMRLLVLLRELGEGTRLVAVRSTGLDAKTALFLDWPAEAYLSGWTNQDAPRVGDLERDQASRARQITTALLAVPYSVLDDDGADALISGLDGIDAALLGR